jgi:hypothetical protein
VVERYKQKLAAGFHNGRAAVGCARGFEQTSPAIHWFAIFEQRSQNWFWLIIVLWVQTMS